MGRFYVGLIIGAYIDDPDGKNTKRRPVVVIDAGDPRIPNDDITVIPITKSCSNPCPPYHIQVSQGTSADLGTGLIVPSWAKCNWDRTISPNRLAGKIGDMPEPLLEAIQTAYFALLDDVNFKDWM